jgi:hypothetical protein
MVAKPQKHRVSGRWMYAYELNPPQPDSRFTKIRLLLRRAQRAARKGGRLWTGRIVLETNITHILVVTDNPAQVNHVDQAIENELKQLNMDFSLRGPARFALELPRTRKPAGNGKTTARPTSRSKSKRRAT